MKKRLNVIQVNGIKGIIFLIGAAICLFAGFVMFPGIVMKHAWNAISGYTGILPTIGLFQGTLLWGITVVSYFIFKKKGFFVEFKSAEDLSREEMEAVMHKIQVQRQSDLIAKSIMRAKELESEMHKELENKNLKVDLVNDSANNEEMTNNEKKVS